MGTAFSDRLLAWWDLHGRHDLPWQHPRTPYRVWVSEIMLQQTQVATVIPYFERFVARFPDLGALAAAPLDDVLAAWSGLGYYARARNLHKAAGECLERYSGDLPATPDELATLPGIGESTANAIVSQAFDVPATVLDGNVRRVMARHGAIEGWAGKASVHRKLWKYAHERLPKRRGADYTQAIMDLGATLCTRSSPSCEACPVRDDCRAHGSGTVASYPSPRPKLKIRDRVLHVLILSRPDGGVLLERRPPAGIWGGLWSLPEADSPTGLARRAGLDPGLLSPLPAFEHRLTHMRLEIRPQLAHSEPAAPGVECNDQLRWFAGDEWPKLGLPHPVQKLLQRNFHGETR